MEPITTAWMMSTLIGGWLGNRGDFWLCKGTNSIYKKITNRIGEPANHNIHRAVRKSYLQASYMAVKKALSEYNKVNILSQNKNNLAKIKSYITKELKNINSDDKYLRDSVLDNEYRELLFPKEESSNNRKKEVILNLKNSIVIEFEKRRLRVPQELKSVIYNGWEEKGKSYDFYELIAAFFTQELKDNKQLSVYIQTEYLDNIYSDTVELNIQINEIKDQIEIILNEYKEYLPKIDKILFTQQELQEGQEKLLDLNKELNTSIDNQNTVLESIKSILDNKTSITKENLIDFLNDERLQTSSADVGILIDKLDKLKNISKTLSKKVLTNNSELIRKAIHILNSKKNGREKALIFLDEDEMLNDFSSAENKQDILAAFALRVELLISKLSIDEAIQSLNHLIDLNHQLNNEKEIIKNNIHLSSLYEFVQEYEKASLVLNNTLVLTKENENIDEKIKIDVLWALSNLYRGQGKNNKALDYISKISEFETLNKDDLLKVRYLDQLGLLHSRLESITKSLDFLDNSIQIQEKNPKKYVENFDKSLIYLANTQQKLGQYSESIKSYERALNHIKENPSKDISKARILFGIATINDIRGEYNKGYDNYVKAINIIKKELGENARELISYYTKISDLLLKQGRHEEANEFSRKALNNCKTKDSIHYAFALKSFANVLSAYNDSDGAITALQTALKIELQNFSERYYVSTLNNLGIIQKRVGKTKDALDNFEKALSIYRNLFGEVHYHTATVYVNIGDLHLQNNNLEEAIQAYSSALEIMNAIDENHTININIYNGLGNVCLKSENENELQMAVAFFKKSLEISKATFGEKHISTANLYNNIGLTLSNLKEFESAIDYIGKSIELLKTLLPPTNPGLGNSYINLCIAYAQNKDFINAFKAINKAKESLSPILPEDSHLRQLANEWYTALVNILSKNNS